MMERISTVRYAVLLQCWIMTDRRTDRHRTTSQARLLSA